MNHEFVRPDLDPGLVCQGGTAVEATIDPQSGLVAQVANHDRFRSQEQIAVQFREVIVTQDEVAIRTATDEECPTMHRTKPVSRSTPRDLQLDGWKFREKMRMRRAVTVVRFQQGLHRFRFAAA